jgi:hypothetical protein
LLGHFAIRDGHFGWCCFPRRKLPIAHDYHTFKAKTALKFSVSKTRTIFQEGTNVYDKLKQRITRYVISCYVVETVFENYRFMILSNMHACMHTYIQTYTHIWTIHIFSNTKKILSLILCWKRFSPLRAENRLHNDTRSHGLK